MLQRPGAGVKRWDRLWSMAPDAPALRGALVASQLVGLGLARYVMRLEPLASADHATVVAAIAPNLQRYLTGPLEPPA